MKKFCCFLFFSIAVFPAISQPLSYYLPANVTYNTAIPKPSEVIYHEVGEFHVTHDRLVNYMYALAKANPDRIKLEVTGFTYEKRPQLLLIISSKQNLAKLEQIRQQHMILSSPSKSAQVDVKNMPVVVYIGHSIHGNEPSGANASLLTAYYLAAGQGPIIDNLLENAVILLDPSFNPDGLQRFSTWVNQHKSANEVSNPLSREFSEVWPGGRFNHYWFDLNRDWLPVVHEESKNRLAQYQRWLPNVLTDHHEQGSAATFFFQPGVPSRVNPLTPSKNQQLTASLAEFHAHALDSIGSLYFTKESYDDFYYGKGSTYPDINGGVGILFEQASSRGHAQGTVNGVLRFPFTIRNQFVTALSTLKGAVALRMELLNYQREFYQSAMKESAQAGAYIFGTDDKVRNYYFADMLLRHRIAVYQMNRDVNVGEKVFKVSDSYLVPANQPQYRLIKSIFDRTHDYKDSLFYDITAWTMPLAYGLKDGVIEGRNFSTNLLGNQVSEVSFPKVQSVAKSNYAYLLDWKDYFAPAALNELLQAGVQAKVSTKKMRAAGPVQDYGYGTILVAVQNQKINSDSLYYLLQKLSGKYAVKFDAVASGLSLSGTDLGSGSFKVLNTPVVALITGTGVNATDAGEVWHLLDQRFNMPPVLLEASTFNRGKINEINTIIMVGGNYDAMDKEKLKEWVRDGGTLILTEEAVSWAAKNGISTAKLRSAKSPVDSLQALAYIDREQVDGAQQMNGVILAAIPDISHPLAYGYDAGPVSFFKSNKVYLEKSKNPSANAFVYTASPLQSGWLSRENYAGLKNNAAVVVNTLGAGRIINIADNPNFRGYWFGGTKLMMNAIFFGRIIDASSGREE